MRSDVILTMSRENKPNYNIIKDHIYENYDTFLQESPFTSDETLVFIGVIDNLSWETLYSFLREINWNHPDEVQLMIKENGLDDYFQSYRVLS